MIKSILKEISKSIKCIGARRMDKTLVVSRTYNSNESNCVVTEYHKGRTRNPRVFVTMNLDKGHILSTFHFEQKTCTLTHAKNEIHGCSSLSETLVFSFSSVYGIGELYISATNINCIKLVAKNPLLIKWFEQKFQNVDIEDEMTLVAEMTNTFDGVVGRSDIFLFKLSESLRSLRSF